MVEQVPIYLIDNHSQALPIWFAHEIKGATLLHLDAHLDVDWIEDKCIQRIKQASSPEDLLSLESDVINGRNRGCYHIGNFIYAAIRLGIVRKIIWVQPDPMTTPNVGSLRMLFAEHIQGTTPGDLRSFHAQNGRIRGMIAGVEITVCQIEHVPEISEPMLLDIDLDYFVPAKPPWRPWCDLKDTLNRLRNNYRTDVLTTVALSVGGGYTPPSMRSLGREMVTYISHMNGQPIEDWTSESSSQLAYNWGQYHLNLGDPHKALPYLEQAIRSSPDVPGHAFYLGVALMALGRHDHACSYLEAAWNAVPDWVIYAMQYATALRALDQRKRAFELMRSVCNKNPLNADAWFNLGMACMQMNECGEHALDYFKKAQALAPANYQTLIWMGKAYRGLGDDHKAAELYAEALEISGLMQVIL